MLSKKIKLHHLSDIDKIKLNTLANEHRLLYNNQLNLAQKDCDFKKLNEAYKNFRNENNLTINSKSAQNTNKCLIENIKSFFALNKNGHKDAKFPKRFKSWKQFCSFTYDWSNGVGGFKISEQKILIRSQMKGQIHNPLLTINLPEFTKDINESNIRTITFKADTNSKGEVISYWLILVYKEEKSSLEPEVCNFMSIDVGCSNISTSISNVIKPQIIKNDKLKKYNKRVENRQSLRDKRTKKSRNFNKHNLKFKRDKTKLTNKKKDFHHKVTHEIIKTCVKNDIGTLIVGDLNVKSLKLEKTNKIKGRQKSGINKATQNNGLSRFIDFLKYKAENENIHFIKQNEAYTTRTNCITLEDLGKVDCSVRELELSPGKIIDRDVNGAINIAQKYFGYFKRDKKLSPLKNKMRVEWFAQLQDILNPDKMLLEELGLTLAKRKCL